jgi:FkbM family methyltransferase
MDAGAQAMSIPRQHPSLSKEAGTTRRISNGELYAASPLKLRISSILTSSLAGGVIGTLSRKRIRHHGLWFDVRSKNFSPRVRAQMFWGIYEGAETRMIRRFLQASTTVIELGSSLGVTTKHVASLMAPGGRLICVEANPQLLSGLREQISPWATLLRLDVIHAAVSNHCGTTALILSPETFGSHLGALATPLDAIHVPSLTLPEIVRKADITDFDLVSDIEGAEASFLLEDPDVLKKCKRAVIELHETVVDGKKVSVPDLMRAAVAAGFQIVSCHGPVVALIRF